MPVICAVNVWLHKIFYCSPNTHARNLRLFQAHLPWPLMLQASFGLPKIVCLIDKIIETDSGYLNRKRNVSEV